MIEIFEKRGRWCYRTEEGNLLKFGTKEEAMYDALGTSPSSPQICDCPDCDCDPCECVKEELDYGEEDEDEDEE